MPNEVDIRVDLLGCGSHSCLVHKPRGQGTSGPCMCIDRNNIEVRKLIWRADQEIARLSDLLREREEEIRRLREALAAIRDYAAPRSDLSVYVEYMYRTADAALRGEQP